MLAVYPDTTTFYRAVVVQQAEAGGERGVRGLPPRVRGRRGGGGDAAEAGAVRARRQASGAVELNEKEGDRARPRGGRGAATEKTL